jgi:hypothetical protein
MISRAKKDRRSKNNGISRQTFRCSGRASDLNPTVGATRPLSTFFCPGHGVGGKVETASRQKKTRYYLYFRAKIVKSLGPLGQSVDVTDIQIVAFKKLGDCPRVS